MDYVQGRAFWFEGEDLILSQLQAFFGEGAKSFFSAISMLGEEVVLILVIGFLYWCYDKKYSRYVGINLLAVAVWAPLIKGAVMRVRPYMVHHNIKCFRAPTSGAALNNIAEQGYSFPSMHSSNSITTCLSVYLGRKNRFTLATAIVLPLLIGISRVYLGVHYPTDVLAGWIFGLLVVSIMTFISKKVDKPEVQFIIISVLGFPGFFYVRSSDFYSCYGLMLGFFAAYLYEKRYVSFKETNEKLEIIIRMALGMAVFALSNELLKLPFSKEFLDSGTILSFIVRAARYMIVAFLAFGIYPMCFKKLSGFLHKFVKKAV